MALVPDYQLSPISPPEPEPMQRPVPVTGGGSVQFGRYTDITTPTLKFYRESIQAMLAGSVEFFTDITKTLRDTEKGIYERKNQGIAAKSASREVLILNKQRGPDNTREDLGRIGDPLELFSPPDYTPHASDLILGKEVLIPLPPASPGAKSTPILRYPEESMDEFDTRIAYEDAPDSRKPWEVPDGNILTTPPSSENDYLRRGETLDEYDARIAYGFSFTREETNQLETELMEHEGFRSTKYRLGNEKYDTIGYGHFLDGSRRSRKVFRNYLPDVNYDSVRRGTESLTTEQARKILRGDVFERMEEIKEVTGYRVWNGLHANLKIKIIHENYRGMWRKSPNTITAVKQGDFRRAAELWMDSKEYRNGGAGIRRRYEALRDALLAEADRRLAR